MVASGVAHTTAPLHGESHLVFAFVSITAPSYLTTRVGIAGIVNAPFQSPVLLGRRFATLDRLSNGRVIAGLGQGWMPQEFATSNVSMKERGKRNEEYIEALRAIYRYFVDEGQAEL